MGDEARFVDRSVDSCTGDEARSDLTSGGDVRFPAQSRIDVIAHITGTGHAIRDHERPGKIREHVHESVHVHVPQARHEKLPVTVDYSGAGGNPRIRSRTGVGDSIAVDQDCVVLVRRTGGDIDYRDVRDRDCVLLAAASAPGRGQ